jgi:predicted MFS family arabinose efflux permease
MAFLPLVATMSLLSRFTGALADRIGPRPLLVVGPLISAAGFVVLSRELIFPGILTLGIGMAITVAPLTTAVMTAIDDERHAGAASGVNNTIARAAGLIAIAAFGGNLGAFRLNMLIAGALTAASAAGGAIITHRPRR